MKIRTIAIQQKYLTKGSTVQILNEISIDYDFAVSTYTVQSLGMQQELPPFEETCKCMYYAHARCDKNLLENRKRGTRIREK